MKKTIKMLALLLVAVMALSLAACTGTEASIKQAQKSLSKVTSVDMELSLDLAVTTNGATEKVNSTAQISQFLNPNKNKTVITTTSGKEKHVVESYLIAADEESGKSVYYEKVYNLEKQSDNLLSLIQKGDTWTATQVDDSASLAQEDFSISKEDIDMFATLVEDFEVLGKEQKYGLNHTVVQGVISGETIMNAVLVNSDAFAGFNDIGTQEELAAAMDELSEMSITVKSWIQDSSLYPVRTIIDMTKLMNALIDDDSVTVDSCVLEITMKNFNRATEFELPEAAKEAYASTQQSDDSADAEQAADTAENTDE